METTASSPPPHAPPDHTGDVAHAATDSSGGGAHAATDSSGGGARAADDRSGADKAAAAGARAADDRSGADKAAAAGAQYDERVSQLDTETVLHNQFLDQSFDRLKDFFKDTASIPSLLGSNETLFAHIHLDSIVKGSKYEGLSPMVALTYFIGLIKSPPVQESLRPSVPEDFFPKLEKLLHRCNNDANLLEQCAATKDLKQLRSLAEKIATDICGLNKGESFLMHGGYYSQVGHSIYYEFIRQSDGLLTLYIYNTQNLKDKLPTISGANKYKVKPYIKYENITLQELFLTDDKNPPSPLVIERLLYISICKRLDKTSSYLSDIFQALISLDHRRQLGDDQDIYMTPQRSGTCAWRSLKGFIYSYFVRNCQDMSMKAMGGGAQAASSMAVGNGAQATLTKTNNGKALYKALITFAKTYSLIWLHRVKEKDPDEKIQLLHATRMFADRLEKLLAQEQKASGSTLVPRELLNDLHALIHKIQTAPSRQITASPTMHPEGPVEKLDITACLENRVREALPKTKPPSYTKKT